MPGLTPDQKSELKTYLLADAEFGPLADPEFWVPGNDAEIARRLNLMTSPPFLVLRDEVPARAIFEAIVWTELQSCTDAERDVIRIALSFGTVRPTAQTVRDGLWALFNKPTTEVSFNGIRMACIRVASRIEALFATGGLGDAVSPAILTYTGPVSMDDISQVLRG